MELFLEFTIIVILATLVSIILRVLSQPLVVGYIITGILLGPLFFNVVHATGYIDLFSKIGITILLFIVGLNLKPSVVKEVGKVSIIGGLLQVILTILFGMLISLLLGLSLIHAFYIGLALSFSSTIIVLKLLSDIDDLSKVYGKISVGFLLIQDLVAIISLLFISSFSGNIHINLAQASFFLLVKLGVVGLCIYLITKYVLSHAIHYLAKSQELLFLFSIGWGLGLASVFNLIGFSVEVGALAAGVSLSVTPYADSIASRLKPLRDFFIVLFFILLGSNLVLVNLSQLIFATIIFSVFVLLGKPLIVFFLMNMLGYSTKQSYKTGLSLAQVSEFSFILVSLGLTIGQLDKSTVTLITLTGLITIAGSSYFILYSDNMYPLVEKLLKKMEIIHTRRTIINKNLEPELILFGYDRVGRDFVDAFKKLNKPFLVVDYNPELIEELEKSNIPHEYGDIEDVELLQELQLRNVKLCVSTIPDVKINSLLITHIKEITNSAIIIVRARETDEAKMLYELGATYVVMPHYLGAKYTTAMIKRIGLNHKEFKEERDKHLEYVNKQ
jgi:Kef-type K+ transport system membrane component KefB